MESTQTDIPRQARITRLVSTLTTDAGLTALRQLANLAEHRSTGTGPSHAYVCQLRRLEREIMAVRRALAHNKPELAAYHRDEASSRIAAFQFQSAAAEASQAPLVDAVNASDAADEAVAVGLSAFEPVEVETVTIDLKEADERERAIDGFWAEARRSGHVLRSRLETPEQKQARLECVAAWCGVREISTLKDLPASQIRSATAAMRRGEIQPGWVIRELAA